MTFRNEDGILPDARICDCEIVARCDISINSLLSTIMSSQIAPFNRFDIVSILTRLGMHFFPVKHTKRLECRRRNPLQTISCHAIFYNATK